MDFLNPTFLWGLLAAPLPLAIHLFYRRRKSRFEFSTIQFFRPRQRYLSHRRRLRELLLLLLRTLALLALALALARPVFRQTPYSFNARTDIAVVLDDTLSMDRKTAAGERAFEEARQKAMELLDTLQSGDGAAVVFVSGQPGIAITRNRQKVLGFLRQARCSAATGSYTNALKQAETHLASSSSPNQEIYLLSDFQRRQAPAKPVELAKARRRVFLLPVYGVAENVSVTGVRLSRKPKVVNQPMRIPFALRNHGGKERGVEVQLEVRGEKVQKRYQVLPAGAVHEGAFEYVPGAAGFVHGAVVVNDSDLQLDNRAYFTANVVENVKVLLLDSDVYSKADPYFFLRYALDPPDSGSINGFEVDRVFVQELTPLSLKEYQVVVLANPDPLGLEAAQLLGNYLRRGGSVLVFAGGKVTSATLAALEPASLGKLFGAKENSGASGLALGGFLSGLNDLLELDLVKWRRLHRLHPGGSAQLLATVEQQPAIVEQSVGEGRLFALAFSARRDYGNWPELKSFPIAMIHLFDYAANLPRADIALECGKALRLHAGKKEVTRSDLEGKVKTLAATDAELVVTGTWFPGVLKFEGADIESAALNPVPDESILEALDADDAAGKIATGSVRVLNPHAELSWQVRNFREGSDLAGVLLFVLLLILVAEAMIGSGYVLAGPVAPAARAA